MQALLHACAGESDTLRLTPGAAGGSSSSEGGSSSSLVALLCKKCRLAFKSEQTVSAHVKMCGGSVLKVISTGGAAKGPLDELKHQAQANYQGARLHHQEPPPPESPSSGLSHEMEDVVNQITALAAQAQAQAHGTSDSNANLFCPPPEPKKPKLFSPPPGVAVPSTGQ